MTDEERLRFIAYCRQSAITSDLLAQQLDTLSPFTARRERVKAMAYSIVAGDLEAVECQSIGTADQGTDEIIKRS